MATLKDIAEVTGVSVRTVSRALKPNEYVKDEVRQRILAVAKELNYTPNRMAQSLRTSKSYEICVLTWSVDELHMKKIVALENELRSHGYLVNLMIDMPGSSSQIKNEMIEEIIRRRPAGVVTLPAYIDHDRTALERFVQEKVLCVAIDPRHEHKERVRIDRQAGAYEAVTYLINKYGSDVIYIGILSEGHNQTRQEGYRKAIQQSNLTPREFYFDSEPGNNKDAVEFVREQFAAADWKVSDVAGQYAAGLKAADFIKQERPRAALVFSDVMCMGLLYGLANSDIRIPEDLAIIGFDDRSCAPLSNPPLTTIAQPNKEAGQAAAEILLSNINESKEPRIEATVIPKLIIRHSA